MTQRYLMSAILHTSHGHVVDVDDGRLAQEVTRYQAADMLIDMLTRQTNLMERGQQTIAASVTGWTFTVSRLGDS